MTNENDNSPAIDDLLAKILVGDVESLPMLPSSLTDILRMRPEDDMFFDKVRELAENDPTFAVRLINLANSASSSPASEITSLRFAIARIGIDHIRGLITTYAVGKIFVPSTPRERNIWKHSLLVAMTAREIARLAPDLEVNPEQAYLSGLLHDIGRFIMLNRVSEGRIHFDEKDWASPVELIAEETAVCGINHVQLGRAACEKWGLPKTVSAVVGCHHTYQYEEDSVADRRLSNFVKVVQMADYFSMTLMKHPDMLEMDEATFREELAQQCVHPGWSKPPVDPVRIFAKAGDIRARAIQVIRSMGLAEESDSF